MTSFLPTNLVWLRKNSPNASKRSQTEVATDLDLKRTTYMNYESGHTEPSLETVFKIASYFGVSVEDLVGVDLRTDVHLNTNHEESENVPLNVHPSVHPMSINDAKSGLSRRDTPPSKNGVQVVTSMPKVVTVGTDGEENAVLVHVKARAGYLLGFGDPEFIESLPVFKLPHKNNGTYRIFEADGLSMFPTLQDKDLVIARWVDISAISDDKVHVLVTQTQGLLIKRVLARLNEGKLICKSDHNERGLYPNIVLEASDVVEAWYVVERMTKHLPSPGEIYKRITDLEADVTLLKQAIGRELR